MVNITASNNYCEQCAKEHILDGGANNLEGFYSNSIIKIVSFVKYKKILKVLLKNIVCHH